MELFVIRHAQSLNNAIWATTQSDLGRSPDPELTDIGQQQAGQLATYLSTLNDGSPQPNQGNRLGLTHLYSSLMVRALTTGTHVANALEMPLVGWEIIHEWGGIFHKNPETGERTGLPGPNRAYFEEHYPGVVLPDDINEKGWWNRPYEPPEAAPSRAATFLNQIIERHGDSEDRVAIFTHAGFSHAFVGAITQYQRVNELPAGPRQIGFWKNNTGISHIRFTDNAIRIIGLNNISHLPDQLIT